MLRMTLLLKIAYLIKLIIIILFRDIGLRKYTNSKINLNF
jgi:hypothetical protein